MGIYFGSGYGGGSLGSYGAGGGGGWGTGNFGSGLSYRSSDSYMQGTGDYSRWLNQGINDYSAENRSPVTNGNGGNWQPPVRVPTYIPVLPSVAPVPVPAVTPVVVTPAAPIPLPASPSAPITPVVVTTPSVPPPVPRSSILDMEVSTDMALIIGLGIAGVALMLVFSGGSK